MRYHIKVIAGNIQYEKEDMYGKSATDALEKFVKHYVPIDSIIVTIEVVDVERTVKV